mmetsp:Transcript_27923/g.59783  ORF Transcript_27923/g.59783 Transcript_27923/m.59783 type:complete len:151 (-) Transcript_27923:741-1193(-)
MLYSRATEQTDHWENGQEETKFFVIRPRMSNNVTSNYRPKIAPRTILPCPAQQIVYQHWKKNPGHRRNSHYKIPIEWVCSIQATVALNNIEMKISENRYRPNSEHGSIKDYSADEPQHSSKSTHTKEIGNRGFCCFRMKGKDNAHWDVCC